MHDLIVQNATWVAGTLVGSISDIPLDGSSGLELINAVAVAGTLCAGAVALYNHLTSEPRTGEPNVNVRGSTEVFDGPALGALVAYCDGGNPSPSAVNRGLTDFRDLLVGDELRINGRLLLENGSAMTPEDVEHVGAVGDILHEVHSDPERVENDSTWRQTIMEKLNDLASKLSEGLSNFKSWLQDLGRAIMNVIHFKPEPDTPAPGPGH